MFEIINEGREQTDKYIRIWDRWGGGALMLHIHLPEKAGHYRAELFQKEFSKEKAGKGSGRKIKMAYKTA